MADKEFIPLPQAAELTGKTLRKLIKFCEANRESKFVKFKNGEYQVRLDFLARHFSFLEKPPVLLEQEVRLASVTKTFPEVKPVPDARGPLLAVLEDQLKEKDRQLAAKDAQISQLIERSREQNNIIFSLEQSKQVLESRLSLPVPEVRHPLEPIPDTKKNLFTQYTTFGLVILLVGLVLMLFYAFLIN